MPLPDIRSPSIESPSRDNHPDRLAIIEGTFAEKNMVTPHQDFEDIYVEGFLLPEGHKHTLSRGYVKHIPGPMDGMTLPEIMTELVENCKVGAAAKAGSAYWRSQTSPSPSSKESHLVRRRQLIERYTRKRQELLELREELLQGEPAEDIEERRDEKEATVEALAASVKMLKKGLKTAENNRLKREAEYDKLQKRLDEAEHRSKQLQHKLNSMQNVIKLAEKHERKHAKLEQQWQQEIKDARSNERQSAVGAELQEAKLALLKMESDLGKSHAKVDVLQKKVVPAPYCFAA